ncbi:MAG: hypothetical protein MI924_24400 [Chloroflexales bacterium]|nr:hypothetical protein [Chloroflexales bacterium]
MCWPAAPLNAALYESFEHSAQFIEREGAAAYLDRLGTDGVPHLASGRAGFPWDAALLHDQHLAESFLMLESQAAATVLRATATDLLDGAVLRGVHNDDLRALAQHPIAVALVPAEPETLYHPRATVEQLAAYLPDAHVMRGFPESPLPASAAVRAEFNAALTGFLQYAAQA